MLEVKRSFLQTQKEDQAKSGTKRSYRDHGNKEALPCPAVVLGRFPLRSCRCCSHIQVLRV